MPLITSSIDPSAVHVLGCLTTVEGQTLDIAPTTPIAPQQNLLWYHSSIYVVTLDNDAMSRLTTQNLPPLSTTWYPATECADRWFISQNPCAPLNTTASSPTRLFTVYSGDPAKGFVSDASWKPCQRYSTNTYSPGICPGGQTIAEITAYKVNASAGVHTYWQASCCSSGMTFGSLLPSVCLGMISTSFRAYAPIITTPVASSPPLIPVTPVYEFLSKASVSPGVNTWVTISNITTITSGFAIADPVVVGWQEKDLRLFPSDYAVSLAKRIGVPPPTNAPTAQPSSISTAQLAPTGSSHGLSVGIKAGIGVGVNVGAAIIGAIIVVLYMRRLRKTHTADEHPNMAEMEDHDQGHGERKWFFGGKWRSEANAEAAQHEIDSNTVHIVPGPPAELEAADSLPAPTLREQEAEARTQRSDVSG